MQIQLGDDVKVAVVGAASGVAATVAMSALMVGAREAGLMNELPPHHIADAAIERTPAAREADGDDRRRFGWLLHFGFGAAIGAAYAVLRNRIRTPGGPIVHGAGFALGVWAVSYLGWIPALGLMPPATDDEPGRPPTMIASHLVFGALLGTMVERALPRH